MKVAVSFIKGLHDMETNIKLIDQSNADYIHVDMMEKDFVDNETFTIDEITKWVKNTTKPLQVHLMVNNPSRYFPDYQKLNTEIIYIHYEQNEDLNELINKLRQLKIKVGLTINPETNVDKIKPYLKLVDEILVMTVVPGQGGQSFMTSNLTKIEELKKIRTYLNLNYLINVDGGVNDVTAPLCIKAGADILVSGSFVCNAINFNEQISKIK